MPKTIVHVNVARILLVCGGIALAWKYLDIVENADDDTKRKLNNSVTSAISFAKWKLW